ncbi:hypothetical protein IQ241_07205 [Romeria aff. gracilis LEGE 07310]|uniref:Uncharacterized protein n=1 Tax=Vasconcelosia minhoensis LEGE 07310 TaxID=915328 RepID=A0A8J7AL52_9CYAN|nr:hypothetical protein [Romeria gracilis]MBE9077085.1 hypothetical protein [Romeria aff. gracilis LEGE 07310]
MLTEAQVVSLKFCPTRRGDRVYTVFKTVDGQELGLWRAASPDIGRLSIGDRVALKRDRGGHWQIVSKRSSPIQTGFYSRLWPTWQL